MLKKLLRKIIREEAGSVVILVTLTMTVLLGMMALVVDVGLAYAERVKLQNTVDAAAMAGAQELTQSEGAAREMAFVYGEKNGVSRDKMSIAFSESGSGKVIQVSAQKPMDVFFASILTNETTYIGAEAKAKVETNLSVKCRTVPFAIKEEEFSFGGRYRLKAAVATDYARCSEKESYWQRKVNRYSWYGALNLGSGWCGYEYRQFIRGRRDNKNQTLEALGLIEVRIGDEVNIKKGVQCWYTDEGIRQRIRDACDDSNFEDHDDDCLRLIVVPVYGARKSFARCEQRGIVEITGLALFFLESRGSVGRGGWKRSGEAWGRFVRMVVPEKVKLVY